MKLITLPPTITPEQFVKRAFWLMYQAAGAEFGFGVFQRQSKPTEDTIWEALVGNYDYPGGPGHHNGFTRDKEVYGDYVAGRMIKFGFKLVDDHTVSYYDMVPTPDYNAWATVYPTIDALVETTLASLTLSPSGS